MGSKKNKSKQINIAVNPSTSEIEAATGGHPSGIHPNVKIILILFAILLLTIVVYSNSINNGFVNWDDNINVYDNISIRELSVANIKVYFTKALLAMYTPLVSISYAIDYKIGGLDPRIYHATNLLFHLLNIIVLFFAVRLLTQRIEIAAIGVILFAVHPLNAGAVLPVSTRSTLLYSFFFLAAFLFYIRYLKNNFRLKYLIFTLVCFLMALLAKSAAVVLPLVLLLTDYYYKRKFDARAIAEKIPFFVLSLIFGILTFVFREDAGHMGSQHLFSVFDRIFLVGYSIIFYLFKVLIPVKLSAYYPYPVKIDGLLPFWFYLTPLFIAAFIFLIYKLQNYRRELIFGSLFFLINIVLVLKIVPMGNEFACDRYAYLPYIGFFLMIGWAYCWVADRFYSSGGGRIRYFFIIAVVATSMAFSAISYERGKIWKDSLTLFNDVLEKYPFVAQIYNNRGIAKSEMRKDYAGAVADFNKAIELIPEFANAYHNRATAKIDLDKDYYGAMDDYNKAIELNPRNVAAYYDRGCARIEWRKDYDGAVADFNVAIALDPGFAKAYYNRATAKIEWRQDYESALADYKKVLEINPNNFEAYNACGTIKRIQKDYEGAVGEYSAAITLNPGYAKAYQNRGDVRMIQKRYGESIADYSEVLRLTPQNAYVYLNRAWSRWYTSDQNGACADWRSSFELGAKEAAAIMKEHCR